MLFASALTLGFLTPIQAQAAAAPGALLVKDASVVEGDASSVVVKIVLERRVSHKVSVSYRTIAKSARSGADFVAASGTVTFPAGTKARKVRVSVLDDALDEATEKFRLRIFDAVGASIIDRSGKVSVFDDDPAPTVSVGNVSVSEPDTGSVTMRFPVTLSSPSGRTTEVTWTLMGGTASSISDYSSASSGRLVIPAGTTVAYIPVTILGDTASEPTETLDVEISSPKHLVVLDGRATGSIVDTDRPSLSVNDVTVNESAATATFTVLLSKTSATPVTFNFATIDGTATAGNDYTSTSNSRTIPAGSLGTTITVPIKEDALDEADETYTLALSNVVNATVLDGEGRGTIVDNDATPTLSINDAAALTEGGSVVFTVTLSAVSGRDVTVHWATSPGTATSGADYAAGNSTLTIPSGQATAQITVSTVNDTVAEGAETFTVSLSSPTNATLADGAGTGTIPANDAP